MLFLLWPIFMDSNSLPLCPHCSDHVWTSFVWKLFVPEWQRRWHRLAQHQAVVRGQLQKQARRTRSEPLQRSHAQQRDNNVQKTRSTLFLDRVQPSHLLSTHLHQDARSLGRWEGNFVHEVRYVPGRGREEGVKSLRCARWENKSWTTQAALHRLSAKFRRSQVQKCPVTLALLFQREGGLFCQAQNIHFVNLSGFICWPVVCHCVLPCSVPCVTVCKPGYSMRDRATEHDYF